jgi:hypothetical protein
MATSSPTKASFIIREKLFRIVENHPSIKRDSIICDERFPRAFIFKLHSFRIERGVVVEKILGSGLYVAKLRILK